MPTVRASQVIAQVVQEPFNQVRAGQVVVQVVYGSSKPVLAHQQAAQVVMDNPNPLTVSTLGLEVLSHVTRAWVTAESLEVMARYAGGRAVVPTMCLETMACSALQAVAPAAYSLISPHPAEAKWGKRSAVIDGEHRLVMGVPQVAAMRGLIIEVLSCLDGTILCVGSLRVQPDFVYTDWYRYNRYQMWQAAGALLDLWGNIGAWYAQRGRLLYRLPHNFRVGPLLLYTVEGSCEIRLYEAQSDELDIRIMVG